MFTPRDRGQALRETVDNDGYERYFGLVESPFALTPNPRFLFKSRSITEGLAHVIRALKRREALVVITGDAGTGKTLLCRLALQQLEPRTFVCVITNPLLSRDELIRQLLTDFGVLSGQSGRPGQASGHDLVRILQQFLASLDSLHAHAVIMIDEAQHLQPEVLEQIQAAVELRNRQQQAAPDYFGRTARARPVAWHARAQAARAKGFPTVRAPAPWRKRGAAVHRTPAVDRARRT